MSLDCTPAALSVGQTAEIVMRIELDDDQELDGPVEWSGPRQQSGPNGEPGGGLWYTETPVEDADVDRRDDETVYHFYNGFTAYQPEPEGVRITVKAWYGECCGTYWDADSLSYVPGSCELVVTE
jgi:hypothetical protein